jgi:hypothetical protein
MLNLDLTKRQTEAFWATLKTSHRIKTKIHILDEDEEPTNDFNMKFGTTHLIDGAIQVDNTQDISRSLTCTFLDPYRRFKWTPDHSSPGSLFTGDFLHVEYMVLVRDENRALGVYDTKLHPKYHKVGAKAPIDYYQQYWVGVPVFHGPLTTYEASGPEITIEAQSKEALLQAPYAIPEGYTLGKHQHVDDAIQEVLRRQGERKFRIPHLPFRLGEEVAVHPQDFPWDIINGGKQDSKGKHVAGLVHRTGKHPHHCYYDAAGRFVVKRLNKDTVFRFYKDTVLTLPDVTYDPTKFINTVIVNGGSGKGKGKKPVQAKVSLPRHHRLSPWSLARNGKPRELTMEVTVENLKTERDCAQRAHHLLEHHSQVGVDVAFDCLPIPTLEPGDVVRVKVEAGFELHAPVKQFTLPLTSSDSMSIGYNKQLKAKGKGHKHGGPKGKQKHGHRKGRQDG